MQERSIDPVPLPANGDPWPITFGINPPDYPAPPPWPVRAWGDGSDTLLEYDNGAMQIRKGGTRSWRNNNPGNLRGSAYQIGKAGGFAVFPDEDVGMDALHNLLASDSYQRLSIDKAIARYAPEFENNTSAYRSSITRGLGVPGTTQLNQLSDAQLRDLTNIIRRVETWQPGRVIGP